MLCGWKGILHHGNRGDHRGQNQAQRDDVCTAGTLCSMLGKDGRDFGCKEYYCCARPTEKWLNANQEEESCSDTKGWKDKWGDGCDWYAASVERCELYGDYGAGTHCCYCKPGPKGGPAANTICTWNSERDMINNLNGKKHKDWTVVLTGDGVKLKDGAILEDGKKKYKGLRMVR